MIVVVVMMLMLLMVMATAAFMIVVVMMMLMLLMVMATAAFMVVVVMMVLMLLMVMATAAFMVMVVMMMLMLLMVMIVMMMLMHMSTFRANLFLHHLICQRYRFLHNLQDLLAIQFFNWSGNDGSLSIDLTKKLHCLLCFFLIYNIRTAHNNRSRIFHLIIKELAKVSHIHLAFLCIYHSGIAVQYNIHISLDTLYCFDHI